MFVCICMYVCVYMYVMHLKKKRGLYAIKSIELYEPHIMQTN